MRPPINFNALPTTVAMANTDVLTGKGMRIQGRKTASFQMKWASTPTGVFSFQINNRADACLPDGTANPAATGIWTTLVNPTAFTAQQPAGAYPSEPTGTAAGGVGYFAFADLSAEWIRPIYKNTSSSGTWTFADGVAE